MSASFSQLFQYYIIVIFPNPEETMYIKYIQERKEKKVNLERRGGILSVCKGKSIE